MAPCSWQLETALGLGRHRLHHVSVTAALCRPHGCTVQAAAAMPSQYHQAEGQTKREVPQENVFMVTELLQCDLHDALGQEALLEQLAWRRRGHQIALDIAKGLSCAPQALLKVLPLAALHLQLHSGLAFGRLQAARAQVSLLPAPCSYGGPHRSSAHGAGLALDAADPAPGCLIWGAHGEPPGESVCVLLLAQNPALTLCWCPADLHNSQSAVHFDLKSPNILLAGDFKAKIAGAPDVLACLLCAVAGKSRASCTAFASLYGCQQH